MQSISEVATARQPDLPTGPLGVRRFKTPEHNPTGAQRMRPFGRLADHVILAATWPGLTARDKTIWSAMAKHENHSSGQCNPRKSTLASETGYSIATVKRALTSLSGLGLVKVHRGPRPNGSAAPNCYEVLLPGSAQVPVDGLPQVHDEPGGRVSVNPPPGVRVNRGGRVRVTPPIEERRLEVPSTEALTLKRESPPARTREAEMLTPRQNFPDKPSLSHTPSSAFSPTNTCPQCERSWPSSWGDVCKDCHATIAVLQRRLDDPALVADFDGVVTEEQKRLAEYERIARERAKREAKPTIAQRRQAHMAPREEAQTIAQRRDARMTPREETTGEEANTWRSESNTGTEENTWRSEANASPAQEKPLETAPAEPPTPPSEANASPTPDSGVEAATRNPLSISTMVKALDLSPARSERLRASVPGLDW